MSLQIGTRVGVYEVIAPIGAGGMGEVYRAHDTRLGRDVALKILPDLFANDPYRRARFQREAQVLASLNHPHIAQIYGFEENALALEYVDGPTLADRIAQGPLPLDEALPIARQIAEALEAAHERGIVHRDLKPANVKLRMDGTVKVLDFGLAKMLETGTPAGAAGVSGIVANSPTITSPAGTMAGALLGTAAYMSPEQAKGRPADKRSDVWALACVIYEMLTGTRAFGGDDVSDTLAAVLRSEPDWTKLPATTPVPIARVLRRSLEKSHAARVPDVSVIRFAIDDAIAADRKAPPGQQPAPRAARRWMYAAAALALTTVIVPLFVWRAAPRDASTPPVQRLALTLPEAVRYAGSNRGELAISADGRRIVFPATIDGKRLLYVREIDQLDIRPIPGTDDASDPFFSPDGREVGYFETLGLRRADAQPRGMMLKRIAIEGGQPLPVADAINGFGASWADDGTIVFASALVRGPAANVTLYRVAATGGAAQSLIPAASGETQAITAWPHALPGAKGVLFSMKTTFRGESAIALFTPQDQKIQTLLSKGSHPRYVPTGHITYMLGNALMAIPFDLERLEVTGSPVVVVENVLADAVRGTASFAFSADGTLVYATAQRSFRPSATELVWVSRTGKEETVPVPPKAYAYPRISPDGTRVALDVRDNPTAGSATAADIWIWDFTRQTLARLTADVGDDQYPAWTPDSKRIAFNSIGGSRSPGIYWQAADGTGSVERLASRTVAVAPYAFTRDGRRLLFRDSSTNTSDDLLAVEIDAPSSGGDRRVSPVIQSEFRELNAELSPDSRWLAYQSDESGAFEIYVRPFPNTEAAKMLISNGGGTRPLSSRNGTELFYVAGFSPDPVRVMRVPVTTTDGFVADKAEVVFEGRYLADATVAARGRSYDVSLDGRFLMLKQTTPASESPAPTPLVVVLNWFQDLKQRTSTP